MRVLDLFCGEGGAARGYCDAGFDVTGNDNHPNAHKRYPFESVCDDVVTVLDELDHTGCYELPPDQRRNGRRCIDVGEIALIHASPPCQRYSRAVTHANKASHPNLIGPVRELLVSIGLPYVIENVPGAPLIDPAELCGCMFGMHVEYAGFDFGLYRPRLFETSFPVLTPGHEEHTLPSFPVLGHGTPGRIYRKFGFGFPNEIRKQVMQTLWMTQAGCSEAIPPAFAGYVGLWARAHIRSAAPDAEAA